VVASFKGRQRPFFLQRDIQVKHDPNADSVLLLEEEPKPVYWFFLVVALVIATALLASQSLGFEHKLTFTLLLSPVILFLIARILFYAKRHNVFDKQSEDIHITTTNRFGVKTRQIKNADV
jgi:hypothetical protein